MAARWQQDVLHANAMQLCSTGLQPQDPSQRKAGAATAALYAPRRTVAVNSVTAAVAATKGCYPVIAAATWLLLIMMVRTDNRGLQ